MGQATIFKLKKRFQKSFPREAELLSEAKTQDDIDTLHQQFIEEHKQQFIIELKKSGVSDETIGTMSEQDDIVDSIALTSEMYETLINAKDDTIENKIHVIMDGLERLKKTKGLNAGVVTAIITTCGIVSVRFVSTTAVFRAIMNGEPEIVAALSGVIIDVAAVVAAVLYLIVLLLIPIIYFSMKPANCVILLINELDKDLVFKEGHSVHGKIAFKTTTIPASVIDPEGQRHVAAGFFATKKDSRAYYGTQYGFVMKYGSFDLAFGVENPLTNLYKHNNCFCRINDSAKDIAEKTDKHNVQFSWHIDENITISIRCNSGSGSTSYYIARAYKTPK